MKFQVFRDPANKEGWRVMYDGKITTPSFNSRGAAYAYMDMLMKGRRKPEYSSNNEQENAP